VTKPKNPCVEGAGIQTKSMENLFNEIITESFPNLRKDIGIQVQDAFRTPNRHDQKRTCPNHII
jgi:hypothetical protein